MLPSCIQVTLHHHHVVTTMGYKNENRKPFRTTVIILIMTLKKSNMYLNSLTFTIGSCKHLSNIMT